MNRLGQALVLCFYECALDVCDAFEDGSYWEEFHGADENARFWENMHSGGGDAAGGNGDAAGTGGSGE